MSSNASVRSRDVFCLKWKKYIISNLVRQYQSFKKLLNELEDSPLNSEQYAILVSFNFSTEISSEKLLIQHLLRAYDRVGRNGRPVIDINTTVPVHFGLGLIQMDLDEKNKVLTISAWTKYVSKLLKLTHFSSIFTIYFPCLHAWCSNSLQRTTQSEESGGKVTGKVYHACSGVYYA